jgi:type VI secretion system protein ImpL
MAVLSFLVSRWALSFLGTGLLAALLWVFGPLAAPLEPQLPRAMAIALMALLWVALNLLLDLTRRKRDSALAKGVASGADAPGMAASAEEAAALRAKLTSALTLLKKARGKRGGYLYEQPWYAIIGPPGAGKTTALLNAGLNFPLAEQMGQGAVAGVGGTRLCDWWFTDEAVLIDTAGRYTTQDSDAVVDRAGWSTFLDLLKRTRPQQPLNGVIVAIALSDIATAPRDERLAHARAIRRRIRELEQRLAVRLPVYALFTKADLIAGFTEFFDDLDRELRNQVWGTTFPLDRGEIGQAGKFAAEFKALLKRLNERLFARIHAERSPDRRALIASFPTQVASLEQPLGDFLREAFAGAPGDPAPMLRGFYMASGTQEGSPIDRLTGSMARAFGVDQRRAPSLRPEQGRSYFLNQLLNGVIFGEAMLVAARPGAARRRFLARAAGFAVVGLLVLAGAGTLVKLRADNAAQIAAMNTAVTAYAATANAQKLDPVGDADLASMIPLLNQARALPYGRDHLAPADPSWSEAAWLGLSQSQKFAAASETVYRHALERVMLPRLVLRVEQQMRGGLDRPEFLYEATRVYLMLGGQGPLDRSLVRAWMGADWQLAFPGDDGAPTRDALARHLDALMEHVLPAVSLDGGLIEAARATFGRVTFAQRVYSRIKPSRAALALPMWRPVDVVNAAGATVFVRRSGKSMADGVAGLYTVDGFYKVVLPQVAQVARDVASESWVLGKSAAIDPASPQARSLKRDVILLYEKDYMAQWDGLLDDLDFEPLRSIPQAAQDLYIIAGQISPMRDLLRAVARQVTLTVPPDGVAKPVDASIKSIESDEDIRARQLVQGASGQVPGVPVPTAAAALPGQEVDDHFRALRAFVGSGPGSPLDFVLRPISDLQQQMAKIAASAPGTPIPTGDDPTVPLRTEALRQPQPVQRWLLAMATSGAALRGSGARQQMSAAYNGATGPAAVCRQVVTGHYPFVAGAADAVSIDDFSRLFGPGGMLDGFFNQQLRGFVDTSGSVWKPQPLDNVAPPLGPADVAQFQRASRIRDLYFGTSRTPVVRFDIRPLSLDPAARQASLEFDGTKVTLASGQAAPSAPVTITWPGSPEMKTVRLSFDQPPPAPAPPAGAPATPAPATPTPAPAPASGAESGPWSLFRLFTHGTLSRDAGAPGHYTLMLRQGEHEAKYDLRVGATPAQNPFDLALLQDFRCPAVQ